MKILVITHDPIRTGPEKGLSSSGFWKEALIELLKMNTTYEIIVAYHSKERKKINNTFFSFRYFNPKYFTDLPNETYEDLLWIIESCKPNLIHVHGTEIPYGLIKTKTTVPVIISLQGFLSESYQSILGEIALPVWKKNITLKERILKNSFLDMHTQWYYNSACEKKVMRENKYFLGRTDFDKKTILKNNPKASYFEANELLREEFYNQNWKLSDIDRFSIYTSAFNNPLKGFHFLLEAVSFLKQEFPEIVIKIAGDQIDKISNSLTGNAYYQIIKNLIHQYNLSENVIFLGRLTGKDVVLTLKKTHVFVLPSLIENSSNALGEAQLIGVPCVVSNCGGTPTIVQNKENGLLFNRADSFDLAQKIKQVFLNDELATSLSEHAKRKGAAFHNKEKIITQYSEVYKKVFSDENPI